MKSLKDSSELKYAAKQLYQAYSNCSLCPRECKVDRTSGKLGFCQGGTKAKIAANAAHFGEEPFISGSKGSGTIFFSNCSMRCLYCQNYQISQESQGNEVSDEELAQMMLDLEKKGVYNINLVSPTHYIPNIISALSMAVEKGLDIPIVYNTNGYEKVETLRSLDTFIDIYLPDIKYSDDKMAVKYSDTPNYVKYNRSAITEMFRQVGNLKLDANGIAEKGLAVRHLVLPNDIAGSMSSFKFLASISSKIHLGLMAQYMPCYKAATVGELNRKLSKEEYETAIEMAKAAGLENITGQEMESADLFVPDFKKEEPFEKAEKMKEGPKKK